MRGSLIAFKTVMQIRNKLYMSYMCDPKKIINVDITNSYVSFSRKLLTLLSVICRFGCRVSSCIFENDVRKCSLQACIAVFTCALYLDLNGGGDTHVKDK